MRNLKIKTPRKKNPNNGPGFPRETGFSGTAFENPFEAVVFSALSHLARGSVLLAAVSGGADSMAMLTALAVLGYQKDFSLFVLHVEHGMRPALESRGDARAVAAFSRKLGVPCRVVSIAEGRVEAAGVEWGLGPEAAARFFRRRALNREARRIGADRILIAHTRDDVLENILIRILRGSGPAGLAPIPVERGLVLRPLLSLTRQDVLDYLRERDVSYRIDATNTDPRYLRNRIRHTLIPCLDSGFPSWRTALLGLAETQALAADFISQEARRRVPWQHGAGIPGKGLWTLANDFFAVPAIVQEEALFLAADKLGAEKSGARFCAGASIPRRQSLRRFAADLNRKKARAADLGPVRVEARENRIRVTHEVSGGFETDFTLLIEGPGVYTVKGMAVIAEDCSGNDFPEQDDIFFGRLPLVLRNGRAGDFIVKAGHKRLLSDIVKKEAAAGRVVFSGFVAAKDVDGIAAFIGLGRQKNALLFCRDSVPHSKGCKFTIKNR